MIISDNILIQCRKGNREAQQQLYAMLSPTLLGICRRYCRTLEDAEDVCVETFVKIFGNLSNFKGEGSFEGWAKRIAINESLMLLRKNQNFNLTLEYAAHIQESTIDVHDEMSYAELVALMDDLPAGYRTIFNLYVVEGYKHKDIAELLGISINTSKSQLIHAKQRMLDLLKKKHNLKLSS